MLGQGWEGHHPLWASLPASCLGSAPAWNLVLGEGTRVCPLGRRRGVLWDSGLSVWVCEVCCRPGRSRQADCHTQGLLDKRRAAVEAHVLPLGLLLVLILLWLLGWAPSVEALWAVCLEQGQVPAVSQPLRSPQPGSSVPPGRTLPFSSVGAKSGEEGVWKKQVWTELNDHLEGHHFCLTKCVFVI